MPWNVAASVRHVGAVAERLDLNLFERRVIQVERADARAVMAGVEAVDHASRPAPPGRRLE